MERDKSNRKEKERLYCEKYREWVVIEIGCKHPKEYCQFRSQCLLHFKSKYKEF
ncbi:MAG: hypothetical protein RMI63_07225 [Caldimicrobium sp.]|nr:hypothetical protein [Caldimicrobium sp.]MDW8094791.1 hypothetical protein [Caldimicrobium sp.]